MVPLAVNPGKSLLYFLHILGKITPFGLEMGYLILIGGDLVISLVIHRKSPFYFLIGALFTRMHSGRKSPILRPQERDFLTFLGQPPR